MREPGLLFVYPEDQSRGLGSELSKIEKSSPAPLGTHYLACGSHSLWIIYPVATSNAAYRGNIVERSTKLHVGRGAGRRYFWHCHVIGILAEPERAAEYLQPQLLKILELSVS